jgi:hypothetical protein
MNDLPCNGMEFNVTELNWMEWNGVVCKVLKMKWNEMNEMKWNECNEMNQLLPVLKKERKLISKIS